MFDLTYPSVVISFCSASDVTSGNPLGVGRQLQALETRETTFPAQFSTAKVGIEAAAVTGLAVKVAQKD